MFRNASLTAWLLVLSCAVASGEVTLEQKLPENSKYHVESTAKLTQKLTINGMEVDTASDTRTTSLITNGKRDASGNLPAEHQIESLNLSMTVMGNVYNFDSANPDNKGGSPLEVLREVHKALAKRLTKITYDANNRVERAETDLQILGSVPDEVQNLVKSEVNPDSIKRTANDELDQLKSDPVKPGDTWQRSSTQSFGAGQSMTFKIEYTYVGPIEKDGRKLEKITNKVLEVDFALQDSPLPLGLKDSKLTAPETEGTILFDRERGQAVESVSNIRITGDLTFTINGTDLPSKLDLKIESTQIIKP